MLSNVAIDKYKNGSTIKDIAEEYGINRKKLAIELRKLGFITNNKNNAKDLTSEDIVDIIKMYKNNISLREIGRIKNVTHNYIKKLLIKHNIINVDTNDLLKDIVYDYYFNQKLSVNKIINILHITETYIRNIFINNGWEFRNSGRIYNFDEFTFHEINTHEKAYWLGFLFADAYNNEEKGELEIILKREDKWHLKKLLKFMKAYETKTKDKIANIGDKEYEAVRINLNSRILSDKLHELGCVQAKSLIVRFPNENILNKEYYPSFIAGYFDGNGHIGIYNKSVYIGFYSGNENMLIDIQNILEINNDILRNTKIKTRFDDTNSCQYLCYGADNAIRLYNYCYVYLPKDTYLKRKQYIFRMLLK